MEPRDEPNSKDELRRMLSAARAALSAAEVAERSTLIRERLLKEPEVPAAASIFIYVSQKNEVDTWELIRLLLQKGKTVTVPLITGESAMEAHRIQGLDDLSPGKFGIPAPRATDPWKGPIDLCIAPGVAFTHRGDRLGRGKAFYDRFLTEHPGAFAIGLCYEFQVVGEIPTSPTDRRVDLIITEKRVLRAAEEVKPGTSKAAIGLLAILLGGAGAARGEEWPGFRGPTGLGLTEEKDLPVAWGGKGDENVLWKAPLKAQGHASPIVWGDSVFVCGALWPPGVREREKVIPEHHISSYRVGDGEMLWDTLVPPGPWLRNDFRSGPGGGYACATPVTDGALVFCAFGSSVIAALDFRGKIVWRKEIVPYSFDVTLGSSPILYGETVILFCAMAKAADSRVVAFDKKGGEVKWERKLPDMNFGHSTPVIIQVNGKPQMLVAASGMNEAPKALRSLDPASGDLLWWCRGAGDVASPAHGAGLVYFDGGRGGPGVAVDPSGSGDVSKTHVRWTVPQVPEGLSSPTIAGDLVYRLHSPDILKCWEAATGKLVYAKRLDGISTTWASPIADPQGRIFFANAGKSYVIQAGREFQVLSVNDLGDGNHPSPAVARGRLYLAGMKSLYCVGARR